MTEEECFTWFKHITMKDTNLGIQFGKRNIVVPFDVVNQRFRPFDVYALRHACIIDNVYTFYEELVHLCRYEWYETYSVTEHITTYDITALCRVLPQKRC